MKKLVCCLLIIIISICAGHLIELADYYGGDINFAVTVPVSVILLGLATFFGASWSAQKELPAMKFKPNVGLIIFLICSCGITAITAYLSVYRVKDGTIVLFQEKILYPGTKVILVPFADQQRNPVVHTKMYHWVSCGLPHNPAAQISVNIEVNYDFNTARSKGVSAKRDMPEIVVNFQEFLADHSNLTSDELLRELFKEHLSDEKIPLRWRAMEVEIRQKRA